MKIAMMVFDLNGIGGIAKHALSLSREFVAMGHQVTVWAVEYDQEKCYPELTAGLDVRSLRGPRASNPDVTGQLPGIRMAKYLKTLANFRQDQHQLCMALPTGYDVVNCHGNMISWAAAEYRRRSGTRVVWMCNDFVPVASYRHKGAASAAQRVKRAVQSTLSLPFEQYDRAAVLEIDRIAVLSDLVKTQMAQHYGVDPVVVRKGVDVQRFSTGDRAGARARYQIPDSRFLLLTVCALMPRRRLEDVIGALQGLTAQGLDITYLIVGRTSHSPGYTEFVRAEIAAHNLTDRVLFAEEVTNEELVDCYQACDAFVWPADETQSWGSAGMEALSAGKPVIVSKSNGLAEILEDQVTGFLVPPRSSVAIAEALQRLIADRALAESVGKAGQQLMREKYSWRHYAQHMVELFHGVGAKP